MSHVRRDLHDKGRGQRCRIKKPTHPIRAVLRKNMHKAGAHQLYHPLFLSCGQGAEGRRLPLIFSPTDLICRCLLFAVYQKRCCLDASKIVARSRDRSENNKQGEGRTTARETNLGAEALKIVGLRCSAVPTGTGSGFHAVLDLPLTISRHSPRRRSQAVEFTIHSTSTNSGYLVAASGKTKINHKTKTEMKVQQQLAAAFQP